MNRTTKWIIGAVIFSWILGWWAGDARYQEHLKRNWEPSEWLACQTALFFSSIVLGTSLLTRYFLIPQSRAHGVLFWVRFLSGLAFAGTLLFAPFQSEKVNTKLKTKTYSTTTAPIWSGPNYPTGAQHKLQIDRLLIMWGAIAIGYYCLTKLWKPKV